MISPGYPVEMAYFTRGLAAVGATVIGVGDQPPSALPEPARDALAHYEHVTLSDEGAVLAALHGLAKHASIDQVECLWKPCMILAARIRESFGLPGMTVERTLPFRDKEGMKQKMILPASVRRGMPAGQPWPQCGRPRNRWVTR